MLHSFLNRFHPVSDGSLRLLSDNLRCVRFRRGEIITHEGRVQHDLYFVREGVQMSSHEKDGKLHVMAFTYPPSLSGIPESFLDQAPARYSLTALSDSEFSAISYERLNRLFDESRELERLFRRISERLLIGVLDRHFELQALGMRERFEAFVRRSPHLLQLVPHKYIASYLGIDPTNFSKLYNSVRI